MRESDEFYARPYESYERYVDRQARKDRLFLRALQRGKTEMTAEAVEQEAKEEKE